MDFELEKLSTDELKLLCKQYNIVISGDNNTLLKKLKYYIEPLNDVLNNHSGRKLKKKRKNSWIKGR